MTTVLGYANKNSVTSSGTPVQAWCRPLHKPTCCMAIQGGLSCCICVPTTATCFIIEMWGQGGGGGGGCCCGAGGVPGGQGGAYGWVACTTSGVNHILCACSCVCGSQYCGCSTCTICSGTVGQFSRVCNCGGPGGFWCVCGGAQGCWGCAFGNANCCCYGSCNSNTWAFWKNCSSVLASPSASTAGGAVGLTFCCTTQTSITPSASTFVQPAATAQPISTTSGLTFDGIWGCLCTCSAFSSPYVWLGACGWSDPNPAATPMGILNNVSTLISGAMTCGGGAAIGGASYAGGDQAMNKCVMGTCYSCWAQPGNYPGGGGMSSQGYTAWTQPGHGAPGLILISWC